MFDEKKMTKEVLAEILKEIDEGIHVVDPDGCTIFYNEVAAKHDGLTVAEVIGKPILAVFPSLTDQTSTLLKVLKTRKPVIYHTQVYTNLHGKKIETINTTVPIIVEGALVGAMEIAKDYSRLKQMSEKLIDLQRKQTNKKELKASSSVTYTFNDILTIHPTFQQIKKDATKLSRSDSSVLVYGESGTGKELFVQGIHHASRRSDGPFIAQNCAAIPDTLLESILFGTVKGSYTGSVDRPGLFELSDGGTLFLDELHAMAYDLQAKLLRVLEDGMVRRVGSSKSIKVDVRVISAMNMNPYQAVEDQKLRSDLFYRLNVLTFELPPLRNRAVDIPYLADCFMMDLNKKLCKEVRLIDDEVKEIFSSYKWPGNVRELKHTMEYMMNMCEGEILTKEHLPVMLKRKVLKSDKVTSSSFREMIAHYEKFLILQALQANAGNIKKTAAQLQLPRQTLQYKLQKYEILYAE